MSREEFGREVGSIQKQLADFSDFGPQDIQMLKIILERIFELWVEVTREGIQ